MGSPAILVLQVQFSLSRFMILVKPRIAPALLTGRVYRARTSVSSPASADAPALPLGPWLQS